MIVLTDLLLRPWGAFVLVLRIVHNDHLRHALSFCHMQRVALVFGQCCLPLDCIENAGHIVYQHKHL